MDVVGVRSPRMVEYGGKKIVWPISGKSTDDDHFGINVVSGRLHALLLLAPQMFVSLRNAL